MSEKNVEIIEYIDHIGRVESIDAAKGNLRVRLEGEHECGACPAANLCHGAENGAQYIDVAVRNPGAFRVGDRVRMRGTERMHRRAIMLATVLPCIALIAIMTLIYVLTGDQLWSALGGLGSMLIFFLALYLARNRVAHEFEFDVRKI